MPAHIPAEAFGKAFPLFWKSHQQQAYVLDMDFAISVPISKLNIVFTSQLVLNLECLPLKAVRDRVCGCTSGTTFLNSLQSNYFYDQIFIGMWSHLWDYGTT